MRHASHSFLIAERTLRTRGGGEGRERRGVSGRARARRGDEGRRAETAKWEGRERGGRAHLHPARRVGIERADEGAARASVWRDARRGLFAAPRDLEGTAHRDRRRVPVNRGRAVIDDDSLTQVSSRWFPRGNERKERGRLQLPLRTHTQPAPGGAVAPFAMTGCVPPPPHPSPSPDPPPVAPPLAFRTFPRSASRFRFRRNLWPRLSRVAVGSSRARSSRVLSPSPRPPPRLDPRSPSPLRSPSSPLPSRRFTLGAAASSNWRETAKTRERARSAETELASAHETIRSLQAKAIARETRLGGEKRELAAEHKRLEERLKETERRHDARVRQVQSAADAKYAALAEKHARLREEHAALQTAGGRAGGGARGATALETDVETERGASHAAALERQAHVMRAEAARSYDQLETAKERRIANLKQQSEYFLKRKDDEIRALRAEASRSERARREEVERLTESCEYLRTWALAMNVVLKRVEDGSYAIREGDGLRRLVIPAKDKPAALDVETLKRRAFAANAFARERGFTLPNDDKATREGPEEEDQLGFAEDDPLGYVGAAETMKPTTKRLGDDDSVGRAADDVPAPDDDQASIEAEKANDANDASTRQHRHLYPGDTFELEAFRTHGRLIDEERRAVQEATLKELSAHPTVEYIRRLEEENARIQRALSRERRSVSDMRVALNAARRAQQESALEFARATRGRGSAAMGGPSAFHSASSEQRARHAPRRVGGGFRRARGDQTRRPDRARVPRDGGVREGRHAPGPHRGRNRAAREREPGVPRGPGGGFFFGARVERVFFDDPAIRRLRGVSGGARVPRRAEKGRPRERPPLGRDEDAPQPPRVA